MIKWGYHTSGVLKPVALYIIFIPVIGCNFIRSVTSPYHEAQMQTQESIEQFASRCRINKCPILKLDTSFHESRFVALGFPVFNAEGRFLAIGQNTIGCEDEQFQFIALRYILENGDESFLQDSVKREYMTSLDPEEEKRLFDTMQKRQKFIADSTKWELHSEVRAISISEYEPFFRSLDGNQVDIHALYTDYVIFHEFSTSGVRTTTGNVARRLIRKVDRLNKEFDKHIQVILVNTDMMYSE